MKRPEGLLLSASAAVLLAALAVAGCGDRPESAFANRPGGAVCVIVAYDAATNSAVASNKTIYLREGKDWAEWSSPDGLVRVTFTGGSPFPDEPKHEKKVLKSKPPKKGTANHGFDYKAVLELAEGKTVDVDPHIEILP